MDSETMATLFLIGTAGYLIFRFWKTVLKVIIGIICFSLVYTYLSLKKYFDGSSESKQKIEQVIEETVSQSTP